VDRKGELVRDLKPENFRGTFRGKPVQIRSANWTTRAPRVVIVLDTSGSMSAPGVGWSLARNFASLFATAAPLETSLALLTFGDRIRERVTFDEGRTRVQAVLQGLAEAKPKDPRIGGRTALIDAIQEAILMLKPSRLGDVIYVISDGGENASRRKPEQIVPELFKARTRLFASVVAWAPPRGGPVLGVPADSLTPVIRATGGDILTTLYEEDTSGRRSGITQEQAKMFAEAALHMYDRMVQFYGLEIEIPVHVDKLRDWKLEIVGPDGKRRNGLLVSYTRKLLPCSEVPVSFPRPTRPESD